MNISKNNFPYPRLNVLDSLREGDKSIKEVIDLIDNYFESVSLYITTNISHDHTDLSTVIDSWTARYISENLLRSLILRNSYVDSMNNYNFPAAYLALKGIVEINGSLAYVLDVIETSLNLTEKSEKLKLVFFGNRGKGPFRIGDIDVPNILTMLTKADKLVEKISPGSKHLENFFTNIYDIASAPSHPSFDAHSLIGKLDCRNRIWQAFSPDEMKNNTTIEFNNQRLLILSMSYLPIFSQLIYEVSPQILTMHGVPYFRLKQKN